MVDAPKSDPLFGMWLWLDILGAFHFIESVKNIQMMHSNSSESENANGTVFVFGHSAHTKKKQLHSALILERILKPIRQRIDSRCTFTFSISPPSAVQNCHTVCVRSCGDK